MERDGFTVETDSMQNIINQMQECLERMTSGIDSVKESIDVLNGKWSGKANLAFRNQFNEDYSKAQTELNTLKRLINDASEAKQAYDSCENRVKSSVRSISF